MSRLLRRIRSRSHWLISIGLVLALIVQPVLAAVGELHEMTHGLDETHLAVDAHGDLTSELLAEGEADDPTAGALHLVHHMAHCCGQTATDAAIYRPAVAPMHGGAVPGPWDLTFLASELRRAPFRPPIAA